MLSTADRKLIRKLRQKKYRWQLEQFIAEGPKVVNDLLEAGLQPVKIFSTEIFSNQKFEEIGEDDLKEISDLSTPNQVLAIFRFPRKEVQALSHCLVLDAINDPGNLGTIIRTADWFGFEKIYCLPGTADIYNAKTVQSTMGSLGRLSIEYKTAEEVKSELPNHEFIVADLPGEPLEDFKAKTLKIALVLGSESHGPSDYWKENAQAVTINKVGNSAIDSLNVAVAAGVFMSTLTS